MNKKQWQDIYKILNEIRSEFLLAYPIYKNGKNKAIRKEAEYKIDNVISTADYLVQKNWEVYELFTGGPNVSDYSRAVIYDEFTRPNYFGGDITKLLGQIEVKINSFEE
jgi:hypothetical protein